MPPNTETTLYLTVGTANPSPALELVFPVDAYLPLSKAVVAGHYKMVDGKQVYVHSYVTKKVAAKQKVTPPAVIPKAPDLTAKMGLPHLKQANLSNQNLQHHDLTGEDITGSHFHMADISHAKFGKAKAENTTWHNVKGEQAYFRGATLHGSMFTGANLDGADFESTKAVGVGFSGANLSGANFYYAKADNANFQEANIEGLRFPKGSAKGATFQGAHGQHANFLKTNLTEAIFTHANLIKANFKDADLTKAKLAGSTLTHANFDGANLDMADLEAAHIEGVHLGGVYKGTSFAAGTIKESSLDGGAFHDCDFNVASIEHSSLKDASFGFCNFDGAGIDNANLAGSKFVGCKGSVHITNSSGNADFDGADLKLNMKAVTLTDGASIAHARLNSAHGCDMKGVTFQGVSGQGANLKGSNFEGCKFSGTSFQNADMRGVFMDSHCSFGSPDMFSGALIDEATLASSAPLQGAIYVGKVGQNKYGATDVVDILIPHVMKGEDAPAKLAAALNLPHGAVTSDHVEAAQAKIAAETPAAPEAPKVDEKANAGGLSWKQDPHTDTQHHADAGEGWDAEVYETHSGHFKGIVSEKKAGIIGQTITGNSKTFDSELEAKEWCGKEAVKVQRAEKNPEMAVLQAVTEAGEAGLLQADLPGKAHLPWDVATKTAYKLAGEGQIEHDWSQSQFANVWKLPTDKAVSDTEPTDHEQKVLDFLKQYPASSAMAIHANALGMTFGEVSHALLSLEKKGMATEDGGYWKASETSAGSEPDLSDDHKTILTHLDKYGSSHDHEIQNFNEFKGSMYEALNDLVTNGHVKKTGNQFEITEKGKQALPEGEEAYVPKPANVEADENGLWILKKLNEYKSGKASYENVHKKLKTLSTVEFHTALDALTASGLVDGASWPVIAISDSGKAALKEHMKSQGWVDPSDPANLTEEQKNQGAVLWAAMNLSTGGVPYDQIKSETGISDEQLANAIELLQNDGFVTTQFDTDNDFSLSVMATFKKNPDWLQTAFDAYNKQSILKQMAEDAWSIKEKKALNFDWEKIPSNHGVDKHGVTVSTPHGDYKGGYTVHSDDAFTTWAQAPDGEYLHGGEAGSAEDAQALVEAKINAAVTNLEDPAKAVVEALGKKGATEEAAHAPGTGFIKPYGPTTITDLQEDTALPWEKVEESLKTLQDDEHVTTDDDGMYVLTSGGQVLAGMDPGKASDAAPAMTEDEAEKQLFKSSKVGINYEDQSTKNGKYFTGKSPDAEVHVWEKEGQWKAEINDPTNSQLKSFGIFDEPFPSAGLAKRAVEHYVGQMQEAKKDPDQAIMNAVSAAGTEGVPKANLPGAAHLPWDVCNKHSAELYHAGKIELQHNSWVLPAGTAHVEALKTKLYEGLLAHHKSGAKSAPWANEGVYPADAIAEQLGIPVDTPEQQLAFQQAFDELANDGLVEEALLYQGGDHYGIKLTDKAKASHGDIEAAPPAAEDTPSADGAETIDPLIAKYAPKAEGLTEDEQTLFNLLYTKGGKGIHMGGVPGWDADKMGTVGASLAHKGLASGVKNKWMTFGGATMEDEHYSWFYPLCHPDWKQAVLDAAVEPGNKFQDVTLLCNKASEQTGIPFALIAIGQTELIKDGVLQPNAYGNKCKLNLANPDAKAAYKGGGANKKPVKKTVGQQKEEAQKAVYEADKLVTSDQLLPYEPPVSIHEFNKEAELPGTMYQGGVYTDKDGKKWFVKTGLKNGQWNSDIAKNEFLVSQLYKTADVTTGQTKLIDMGDGTLAVANEFLPKPFNPNDEKQKQALYNGFAMDAWLGNWNVIGGSNQNVHLNDEDMVLRTNMAGALLFRADGSKKTSFDNSVDEWEKLQNSSTNPSAANVFSAMPDEAKLASIALVASFSDEAIKEMVQRYGPGAQSDKEALTKTLIARREDLKNKAKQYAAAAAAQAEKLAKMYAPVDIAAGMQAILDKCPHSSYSEIKARHDKVGKCKDWGYFMALGAVGSTPAEAKSNALAIASKEVGFDFTTKFNPNAKGQDQHIGQRYDTSKTRYAATSKYNKQNANGKSQLKHYTGSGSSSQNGALRTGKPSNEAKEAADCLWGMAENLNAGDRFARGLSLDPTVIANFKNCVGHVIQEPGFTSTSGDDGQAFGGNVSFQIYAAKGAKAGNLTGMSQYKSGEHEVLFGPSQRYLILGVGASGGSTLVHLLALPTDPVIPK